MRNFKQVFSLRSENFTSDCHLEAIIENHGSFFLLDCLPIFASNMILYGEEMCVKMPVISQKNV